MGDLNVDPQVLHEAADGITGIIGGLSGLGVGQTGALGRGFSLLGLSPEEAGKQEVQKNFEEFTERWSWGVRYLVQAANEIAEVLDLSAGRYHIMDEESSDTFKTAWTHLLGNPHLSDEEISERSWGETFADNPINNVMNPDYSGESFDEAFDHFQTNSAVVGAVGDQALANLSPAAAAMGVGDGAHYHSGAAAEASEIVAGSQAPAPGTGD
ncbi:hypothetical protein GIY30_15725 [Gordonia sp. HNM0687]|uniref:Uncharacterized protein n=1 Tax=Gordonia mangrovi TaxID=2665643 RepID=A0A6L7GUR7_9ACTN|nr:hypothetical protein [Gordonia mangrovi]MXP22791.1 hypothetical protein [Gordonia mangrovi]UVF77105.1 hypothetical protein NWF22_17525 [Gordonia mangrovi]